MIKIKTRSCRKSRQNNAWRKDTRWSFRRSCRDHHRSVWRSCWRASKILLLPFPEPSTESGQKRSVWGRDLHSAVKTFGLWPIWRDFCVQFRHLYLLYVKTSYFYFKGSKIQIFPDFWQLFLFLLSKVIQNDFPWLQDDWKMTCRQKNPVWMTFESKKKKSCQKSGKIWIYHPLKQK